MYLLLVERGTVYWMGNAASGSPLTATHSMLVIEALPIVYIISKCYIKSLFAIIASHMQC